MAIGGSFVRPKPLKVGLVKQLFDRIEELDDDRHVGRLYDTLVFNGVKRITDAAVKAGVLGQEPCRHRSRRDRGVVSALAAQEDRV